MSRFGWQALLTSLANSTAFEMNGNANRSFSRYYRLPWSELCSQHFRLFCNSWLENKLVNTPLKVQPESQLDTLSLGWTWFRTNLIWGKTFPKVLKLQWQQSGLHLEVTMHTWQYAKKRIILDTSISPEATTGDVRVCCLVLSSIDGYIIGDLQRDCVHGLHTMRESVEDAEWERTGTVTPVGICWERVAHCQLSWDSHWLKDWSRTQKRNPPLLGTREM